MSRCAAEDSKDDVHESVLGHLLTLHARRIEIDFSDPEADPKVRVMGGDDFDDPRVCTIGTGVYRDGKIVWDKRKKAS